MRRGGRGGGWEFDPVAVRRYLEGDASAARIDAPAAEAQVLPIRPAGQTPTQTKGEETATARLKAAQAALQEDRLKKARGELVQAEDVSAVLTELMIQLRSELLNIPDAVGRDLDYSDRAIALMKRHTESALRNAVRTIRRRLAETAQPTDPADA